MQCAGAVATIFTSLPRACLQGAVRSEDDLVALLNIPAARAPALPAPVEAVALA